MAEFRVSTLQVVGAEGEVTFRKEYAGCTAAIRELGPGTWIVKIGELVPANERWLLDPKVQADLDRALAWAERNPPRTTDLREFEEMLGLHSDDD